MCLLTVYSFPSFLCNISQGVPVEEAEVQGRIEVKINSFDTRISKLPVRGFPEVNKIYFNYNFYCITIKLNYISKHNKLSLFPVCYSLFSHLSFLLSDNLNRTVHSVNPKCDISKSHFKETKIINILMSILLMHFLLPNKPYFWEPFFKISKYTAEREQTHHLHLPSNNKKRLR